MNNPLYIPVIIIVLLITLVSCNSKKQMAEPQYYLENALNEEFNLKGPVEHFDRKFFADENLNPYPARNQNEPPKRFYPLTSYGGHYLFDKYGLEREVFYPWDSLHFINPDTINDWKSVYTHVKPDFFPSTKNEYNRLIITPGKLRMSSTYYTDYTNYPRNSDLTPTIDTTEVANGSKSSWDYYSYELDSIKRVKHRRLRKKPYDKPLPYYSEVVTYHYDSINRIVKEDYKFYENLDKDVYPLRGGGETYFDFFFRSLEVMNVVYEYDTFNRVSKAIVNANGELMMEQEYFYASNLGEALKKIIIKVYTSTTQSYIGNITELEMNNQGDIIHAKGTKEDGTLLTERWVDYYDYDTYGNWTKCKIYFEKYKDAVPDIIGHQYITYYPEE